jgi:hypothetical protein
LDGWLTHHPSVADISQLSSPLMMPLANTGPGTTSPSFSDIPKGSFGGANSNFSSLAGDSHVVWEADFLAQHDCSMVLSFRPTV